MDSKPRDFNYLLHKENFPLELKGTMRRRPKPQSSLQHNSQYTTRTLSHTSSINDQTLVNRIIENYQDLKSILPTDQSNIVLKKSIKVYNNEKDKNGSGAAFLMSKMPSKLHAEKKHIGDKDRYQSVEYSSNHPQRKHFPKQVKQGGILQENKIPKKHAVTLWKKIDNDLYSNTRQKQNYVSGTVRMSDRNMFREGVDMGLEEKKQPKISTAKMRQVIGSGVWVQELRNKKYKNDWRKTSIILG